MASTQIQVASLGRSPALDALTSRIPNPFTPAKPAEGAPTQTDAPAPTAQPTPAVSEPQLISTGSLSGRETKRITPNYPPNAKSRSVTGTVRVFAIVDENGKIWVTNSEGPMLLRQAAEEAARAWTFPPSTMSGKPVRFAGYIDFEFKL
jgi:TonB family protein